MENTISEKLHISKETRDRIGKKLRRARIEKNMTQRELAKILGLTHAGLGSYETGRLRLSAELLVKLCDILERPMSYFVGYDPELERKEKEREQRKREYFKLDENIQFEMELSIRNYLRSKGIKGIEVEQKLDKILKFIDGV
jgi:transcriptional regulator with XRE-family HTH domain